MCHNFCSSCNKKVILVSKPKFSCIRIPKEIRWIWLEHIWIYIMTWITKKQQNAWLSHLILKISRNLVHLTNFSRMYPNIFWQGIQWNRFKHNRTLLNFQEGYIWYKDKFKITTKSTFFHLIYRNFESNEHVKCMVFIYVLTLLFYVGN